MPTLLQINTSVNRGSTGHIAEQIADMAMKNGWKCYTAYSRRANPSKTITYKIGNLLTVRLHGLYTRLFDMAGLGAKRATRSLIKYIDEIAPDIVHLHNIHGYVLNYKLLFEYLNKNDIPVVWTFHDFWAITGHCSHFVSINCKRWQVECDSCPLTHHYPASYMDFSKRNFLLKKELFSKSNLHVIAVSKWVEDIVVQSFLKGKDIQCIENAVDTSVFKPSLYKGDLIPNNKFVIMGVASQWGKGKGLYDYFLLSKKLSADEVIVLVGLNDKQLMRLPKGIIGIKRTDSVEELAQLYSRADIVTSLSYAETFGMTILESYACGTPTVVYDNTAQPHLVKDETGRIVPTGDINTLYNVIQELKLSDFKRKQSSSCVSYARDNFNIDRCCNKYLQLYNSLIKKSYGKREF